MLLFRERGGALFDSGQVWGKVVRVQDDLRKTVIFIGVGSTVESFESRGTAFFLAYDDVQYLVTSRHVAEDMGDDPITLRMNKFDGSARLVGCDPLVHRERFPWLVHSDETADLAIMPLDVNFKASGVDWLVLPQDTLLKNHEKQETLSIGPGDFCYAVGLFRFLPGKRRNLPILHTGHIALLPSDERIPVKNWRYRREKDQPATTDFEGYLVQMPSVEGLSGSPVFVRASNVEFENLYEEDGQRQSGYMATAKLYLLGVWRSAWGADADQTLASDVGDHKVPVGFGCVEPAYRLVEILESSSAKEGRQRILEARKKRTAATPG
jgi:hypothetical protein